MTVQEEIINSLDLTVDLSEQEILNLIDEKINILGKEQHINVKKRENLRRDIFNSIRKLGILQELIEDPEITEIMVNGISGIFIEKKGRLYETEKRFESKETLREIIFRITADCNRTVNESSPIVDARLMDGSRVNVVLDPVALNGPILTIRRFPVKPIMIEDLLDMGCVTKECADFLKLAVEAGLNILVSGGTGSGKTTPDKSTQFSDGKSGY